VVFTAICYPSRPVHRPFSYDTAGGSEVYARDTLCSELALLTPVWFLFIVTRGGTLGAANDISLEAEPARSGRRLKPSRYIFVVGLVVYCAVVWYFGWQGVRDALLDANLGMVVAAAGIFVTATWCRALKWRYALGPGHHSIGLFFISKATGNWSPGRVGEFAPMALRRHRTPKIGAWIMLDRVIEILVTLTLGLIGLALIELLPAWQFAVIAAATVSASVGAVVVLTRRDVFVWFADRARDASVLHRVLMMFAAISEELYLFARKLPLILGVTVATKAADLLAVMLIFSALGYRVGFALAAAAKCALAIVSFIPITPAATGVPHGAQAWMMNEVASVPPEILLAGIGIEVVILSVTFWTSFGLASPQIRGAAT